MKFTALILMPLLLACASSQPDQRFDCKLVAQAVAESGVLHYLERAIELRTRDAYRRSKEYAEGIEREICIYVGAFAYVMPSDVAQECYPGFVAPVQKLVNACHIYWRTEQEH